MYIQAKFQKEGTPDQDNFAPFKVTLKEHLSKNMVNGKLIIKAVHAKYLLDESNKPDPFLKFTLPSRKELTTKHLNKTCFPVWNERVEGPVKMSRNEAAFIDVEVIDNNLFKNTALGKFVMDVEPCYAKPNTWVFNKAIEVEPPKDRESKICFSKMKRKRVNVEQYTFRQCIYRKERQKIKRLPR